MDPIDAEVMEGLDLGSAVRRLVNEPMGLLPNRGMTHLLSYHGEDLATRIRAQMRVGLSIEDPLPVTLPKKGGGLRPLTPLGPSELVLFTALAEVLTPHLPSMERTHEAYESFSHAPLEDEDARYVVMADVVAYHDSVDHGILLRELVESTGQWEIPRTVVVLLESLMGGSVGLPQLYWASDQLAECVIDIARRRLVRSGRHVVRYSDDFRISARTWGDAQRAVEALYSELRNLGLVLNESKTLVLKKEHYAAWVREPAELWAQVLDALEVDEDFFPSLYGVDDPEVEGQLLDLGETAGQRALAMWAEPQEAPGSQLPGLRGRFAVNLATLGLRALGQVNSSAGLDSVRRLLTHAPGVTREVAWYLSRTATHDPEGVESLMRRLLTRARRPYLMPWQHWWLLDVVRQLPDPLGLGAWMRRLSEEGTSPYVRSYACLVRSMHGEISESDIASAFATAPALARLDLALAVGVLTGGRPGGPGSSIYEEGPPYSWLVETGPIFS